MLEKDKKFTIRCDGCGSIVIECEYESLQESDSFVAYCYDKCEYEKPKKSD